MRAGRRIAISIIGIPSCGTSRFISGGIYPKLETTISRSIQSCWRSRIESKMEHPPSKGIICMKDKAIEAIYSAIDDLNEQLSPDARVDEKPDSILLGSGGKIDSVGFINLIVLLEEKCQERF